MQRRLRYFNASLMVLMGSIVILGCAEQADCGVTEQSEELFIGFFDIADGTAREVVFDSMRVDFQNANSIFFIDTAGSSGYIFPLDLQSDFTTYSFITDSVKYDLRLEYNQQVFIDNPDCGPVFRIFPDTVISERFDSLAIQVTELSKNISPHVEVYF